MPGTRCPLRPVNDRIGMAVQYYDVMGQPLNLGQMKEAANCGGLNRTLVFGR